MAFGYYYPNSNGMNVPEMVGYFLSGMALNDFNFHCSHNSSIAVEWDERGCDS